MDTAFFVFQHSEISSPENQDTSIEKEHGHSFNIQKDVVNWTRTLQTEENECIFVAFSVLFPYPLWVVLLTYAFLNASLIASAVYK